MALWRRARDDGGGWQPLSKLAVQDNVSGAVVVAAVRQDDAPVSGAMVEFARSVAGQVAEYAWSGMTDELRVRDGGWG